MRRNRAAIPFLLLALAVPSLLRAQQTSGGSTYSVFNIGDLPVTSSITGIGRGGIEDATPSPYTLNSLNPAGWSDLRFVTIQASLVYEQYKVSDPTNSIYQNNTKIQGFSAGFPYSQSLGGTVGIGFRPYSTVNYRTQVEQTVPTLDTVTQGLTTFQGRGGISEMVIGTSLRPMDWLSLGVTASRYFGTVESETVVNFPDGSLESSTYRAESQYGGWGARVGVRLDPSADFHIGATLETGATLTRNQLQISDVVEQGTEVADTTSLDTSSIKIPPRVSVGAAYRTGRFLLSADGSTQFWDKSDFSTARTSSRVAVGLDRLANESPTAAGFDRWTVRGGLYYDQTYYALPNGNINQYGLALGATIPLTRINGLNANTILDVAAEVGRRGMLTNGLTQETYLRFYLALSVSELWFVKARR